MVAPRAFAKPSMQWVDKDGQLTDEAFRVIRWLQGVPPTTPLVLVLTPSPVAYQATKDGAIVVDGGIVSTITLTRSSVVVSIPATSGMFPVRQNDVLTITYTVAPTVTVL